MSPWAVYVPGRERTGSYCDAEPAQPGQVTKRLPQLRKVPFAFSLIERVDGHDQHIVAVLRRQCCHKLLPGGRRVQAAGRRHGIDKVGHRGPAGMESHPVALPGALHRQDGTAKNC